jgi:hypothetical protein
MRDAAEINQLHRPQALSARSALLAVSLPGPSEYALACESRHLGCADALCRQVEGGLP